MSRTMAALVIMAVAAAADTTEDTKTTDLPDSA